MPQYYANCSYGSVRFLPQNNLLVPQVISVPCTGRLASGQPYNLSNVFGTAELYGLMEAAENYTTQVLKMSIPYATKRRVAILPIIPNATWSGLGSVGCAGSKWVQAGGAAMCAPWLSS